jgi:hypothetical protein
MGFAVMIIFDCRECLTQMIPMVRALLSSSWDPAIRQAAAQAKISPLIKAEMSSRRGRRAQAGDTIIGTMVEEDRDYSVAQPPTADGGGGADGID